MIEIWKDRRIIEIIRKYAPIITNKTNNGKQALKTKEK